MGVKTFSERLSSGEPIIVAEGYLFELERRGYLQAGPFCPEAVLKHPDVVKQMHEEFVHAGSDATVACTFYATPEKCELAGLTLEEYESMNRNALKLARLVANKTRSLMCGDISLTSTYKPGDAKAEERVRKIFKEQVIWAAEEGADYIVGETFDTFGEAKIALETIKQYGNGLPAVITLGASDVNWGRHDKTVDGYERSDACALLQNMGAAVVGLNCTMGPAVMLNAMKSVIEKCNGPVAALPVCYRTTPDKPLFFNLQLPGSGKRAFFEDLDHFLIAQSEVANFGRAAKEMGIKYVGLCCGNSARYTRTLAEATGRRPAASKYSADMSRHLVYGTSEKGSNEFLRGALRDAIDMSGR